MYSAGRAPPRAGNGRFSQRMVHAIASKPIRSPLSSTIRWTTVASSDTSMASGGLMIALQRSASSSVHKGDEQGDVPLCISVCAGQLPPGSRFVGEGWGTTAVAGGVRSPLHCFTSSRRRLRSASGTVAFTRCGSHRVLTSGPVRRADYWCYVAKAGPLSNTSPVSRQLRQEECLCQVTATG